MRCLFIQWLVYLYSLKVMTIVVHFPLRVSLLEQKHQKQSRDVFSVEWAEKSEVSLSWITRPNCHFSIPQMLNSTITSY